MMRVPAEGGAPASLVFTAGVMRSFDLSPDGSRFVYNAREFADELWALDNVLGAQIRVLDAAIGLSDGGWTLITVARE